MSAHILELAITGLRWLVPYCIGFWFGRRAGIKRAAVIVTEVFRKYK